MQNENGTISTWDGLMELGFLPDEEVISDIKPGLSFDFGNFKVSASSCMNMRFREVVLFTGALITPRTIAEVQFEMPRYIQSPKQCAAWIVWHLDKAAGGDGFVPAIDVDWLSEGRSNTSLLPWVEDKAEYETRPKCVVEKVWLRLALKSLSEIIATVSDEEKIAFGFDGSALIFRFAEKVVLAIPAKGTPWQKYYTIQAGKIKNLPKRFTMENIEVSIWNTQLTIGQNSFEGVTAFIRQ